jgi:hypothetical protein
MRLSKVHIRNFKSLADTGEVNLDRINVLVGRNNHGKSAFVQAVHLIQSGARFSTRDIRLGTDEAEITYVLEDVSRPAIIGQQVIQIGEPVGAAFKALWNVGGRVTATWTMIGSSNNHAFIRESEPYNFIYTYLSKRKVTEFDQVVNLQKTLAVSSDLRNIVSKVDRLANPAHHKSQEYTDLCMSVLGFRISSLASTGGHQAGIPVGPNTYIPIEDMGEGVSSLLGLITDLCVADGNLFLIEEPENDIHPDGLKTLLSFIVAKSEHNQFIVTTHSNIVTRYLGAAEGSKIFEFKSEYEPNRVPTTEVRVVENTPEARINVLRQLGYELSDFYLWDAWMILEESSAEFVIQCLIPWFVPRLSRVRTVAAGGTSKVGPTFEDYRRLFLFAHLEPQYRNRAWVIVDGDDEGQRVTARLREKYQDWPSDQFRNWTEPDFERYFPAQFSTDVTEVLGMPHDQKWEAKKALHKTVNDWCRENPDDAKKALAESAAEVIGVLQAVDRELFGPPDTVS